MSNTNVEQQLAIEALRDSALERLDRLERHERREAGALAADSSEQANETSNDETVAALLVQLRGEVSAANAALAAIEQGTYGKCSNCGGTIRMERLKVMPTTALCIKCA